MSLPTVSSTPPAQKGLLQAAAVIGQEVTLPLLQALVGLANEELRCGLRALQAAEFVYETCLGPVPMYTFKHVLTQEVAYQSLLHSTRAQYHCQIAQVIEAHWPALAATQPELLAHHYTEAGLSEQAVGYWQRAGEHCNARSAYVEAVAHCTKGLTVLQVLPDTPERAWQEINIQVALGRALQTTKGFAAPEVEATYHRAHELCRLVGETPQLFSVLDGIIPFHTMRVEFQIARELTEEMLSLAQCVHDPADLRDAHIMLGNVLLFCGDLDAARVHLEQGLALDISQQPRSVSLLGPAHREMFGLSRLASTLWYLGYPDQALQRGQAALTLARELAYPFSLASALIYAAILHCYRREAHLTYEYAEAALVLAREQGFAERVAEATMLRGWALVEEGQGEAGIAQIRQGLAAHHATGAEMSGFYRALLGEACRSVGQIEEGLQVRAQRLAIMHSSRPGSLMAELYRLKGELLLTRSAEHQATAETCFRHALTVACRQPAKSLELRATRSLARLWQQQGKHAEAYELLAPIYGWFTEGFDTADLRDAQALLAALAQRQP